MPAFEPKKRRVLIASSHPLFGQGLRSLLQARQARGVEVIGIVATLEQALEAWERLNPDLIIVDYDDEQLNRDEFLARFVEGEKKLRVVLLSLQSSTDAIVYDRRTLAASQIEDWLNDWKMSEDVSGKPVSSPAAPRTVKSKEDRRNAMKHLVIAGLLVLIVTAALIFGLERATLLPVQAAEQARPIDSLFRLEFMVIAFLFALIVVFMVYSVVAFRRKKGDSTDAVHIEGNTRLEVMWTRAPLATVLFFAYLGGQSLAETVRADPRPMEVNVIGQQWSWRFEYPEWGIVSTELMLPAHKQALLRLWSTDVIHSFWVPEFRVKQDALPGGEANARELRVTPNLPGEYSLVCAELCGLQHAYMTSKVKVVSQQEFDDWVVSQTGEPSGDPVARGSQLVQQYGCIAYHSLDGTVVVGPSWKGIYGHQVTLADGTSVNVDEAYLEESIINPSAKLVQGFQNLMPNTYRDQLNDEQIADIIEFIKSLR
jgi:cytochrome c oxidase subunit 2